MAIMEEGRKDVRLVTMISPKMDDDIVTLAEMKGLNKSEIVRYAIAEYVSNQKLAVKMVGDLMKDSTIDMLKSELSKIIKSE